MLTNKTFLLVFFILVIPLPEMNLGDNWHCGHVTWNLTNMSDVQEIRDLTRQCT